MAPAFYWVDAFAEAPFGGNPAAVCLLDAPAPDPWMQALAAEMNLSETAFVAPQADGFGLRWFTPQAEVDLCGHATLASAHALWESGWLGAGEVARFHTRSGELTARQRDGAIELDFPATPPEAAPPEDGLLDALGLDSDAVRWSGRSRFDALLVLRSPDAVLSVSLDGAALSLIPVRGVIVTAQGSHPERPASDFVSRFFAPAVGVPEDPVTGSAHACLGPYWQRELGRDELVGVQLSQRGGRVETRMQGDRVMLAGRAVTVVQGTVARPLSALLI